MAAPSLQDPNFFRTVVLIVEHNDEGAMGIVLNREADTGLDEAVPDLDRHPRDRGHDARRRARSSRRR